MPVNTGRKEMKMEHSKGKLESNDIFPWDLWIGADKHLFTVHGEREIRIANAERLKKCWNEHDTLETKAALHDELVDGLERFVSGITNDRPDAGDEVHMALINGQATLARCKAVK